MSCQDNCSQCRAYPCTCSRNFWILLSGDNLLKGCECDPDNPIRLHECFIFHAITHSARARHDFDVLYESLFPCEKERFTLLFRDNPMLSRLVVDCTTASDQFQSRLNRIPVYTAGQNGGRRLPVGRVSQLMQLPPHFAPKSQPRRCGNT
jgi:hypothetical protein